MNLPRTSVSSVLLHRRYFHHSLPNVSLTKQKVTDLRLLVFFLSCAIIWRTSSHFPVPQISLSVANLNLNFPGCWNTVTLNYTGKLVWLKAWTLKLLLMSSWIHFMDVFHSPNCNFLVSFIHCRISCCKTTRIFCRLCVTSTCEVENLEHVKWHQMPMDALLYFTLQYRYL